MTIAGAWIGCMLAPKPNEKYGRRLTLLYNNVLFIIGEIWRWRLPSVSPHIELIFFSWMPL